MDSLTLGDWAVVAFTGLQFVASVTYLVQREYPAALTWLGIAVANSAILYQTVALRGD